MEYLWFKIFNQNEFRDSGLTSLEITLELEGIGEKDILITRGEVIGFLYEGVFLVPNFLERIPFVFDGFAAYRDEETSDVYLGFPQP